jgi:uncharacterized RDD family membrane protein YckC
MSINNSHDPVLATPQHRIGAVAVDAGLYIVTFGIGYFIWSMIAWTKGQTPGKSLLKIRVLDETTLAPVNWGRMAIRQVLIPMTFSLLVYLPYIVNIATGSWGLGTLASATVGITAIIWFAIQIIDFVWLIRGDHKRLIDVWAKTIVVNEAA